MDRSKCDFALIGGSAGAIEPITKILEGISPDVLASVFVVVHSGENSPQLMAKIFANHTALRVCYAEDPMPIELGTVYVAPPDRHMLIKDGDIRVIIGPKENNFRPAIDPLFRSAANSFGRRVCGIVVSGMMDDGARGLAEIKRNGGITIVQSPDESQDPSMPVKAAEMVNVDYVLAASEIGKLLSGLLGEDSLRLYGPAQIQIDPSEGLASPLRQPNSKPPSSPFICPNCGGSL